MYSVLIQNQSTMESFHEHHALFMEALNNKTIGTCRWNESGTTIETALPELDDKVNDKEEWRAIIIRVVDEDAMKGFEEDKQNPYDFKCKNQEESLKQGVRGTANPLVCLSHILCGIPAPDLEFTEEMTDGEDGQVPHVVYRPKQNPEMEANYNKLSEKYEHDGKEPTELVMITFHRRAKIRDSKKIEFAWEDHLEHDSSEFWKRNNYPGKCRFLVYDYAEQGSVQKCQDLFNFWTTVMLIATNDINPSSMQAYRLYSVKTTLDRKVLKTVFQQEISDLVGTKDVILAESKREIEKRIHGEENPIVMYEKQIPVAVPKPDGSSYSVNHREFHLCANTKAEDYNRWDGLSSNVEASLDGRLKVAERALEKTTDNMRYAYKMDEEEILPLNHFQEEEIQERLDGLYAQILNAQDALSGLSSGNRDRMKAASEKVRQGIKPRILKGEALEIAGIIFLGLLIVTIPGVLFNYMTIPKTWLYVLIGVAFLVLAYLLTGIIVLLVQRRKFRKLIHKYNEEADEVGRVMEDSIDELEDFVSDVVTYSRGYSYLDNLRHKRFRHGFYQDILMRNRRACNDLLDRIRDWCEAFYIDCDFTPLAKGNYQADLSLLPTENRLYTFEYGREYKIPINEAGDFISSPFEFAKKLNIDREELFEDARTTSEDNHINSIDAGADSSSEQD